MSHLVLVSLYQKISELVERRPTLIVTSPSLVSFVNELPLLVNITACEAVRATDWCILQRQAPPTNVEAVIGFGGGTVMDVAKLRGAQLAAEVTCVPTLLSTDAFLTPTAAVRYEGRVRYLPSGAPSKVVIDEDLLSKAPPYLHALGCCDVLSILTASEDWRTDPAAGHSCVTIADGRRICEELLGSEDEIAAGSPAGLRALITALEAEVELCATCGNDRIEEGSEHYFAYALEPRVPPIMHGALVGLGILFSSLLQGSPVDRLQRFVGRTGISSSWQRISGEAIVETLLAMPDFVREEGYPASVWNRVALKRKDAEDLCDLVLGRVRA